MFDTQRVPHDGEEERATARDRGARQDGRGSLEKRNKGRVHKNEEVYRREQVAKGPMRENDVSQPQSEAIRAIIFSW